MTLIARTSTAYGGIRLCLVFLPATADIHTYVSQNLLAYVYINQKKSPNTLVFPPSPPKKTMYKKASDLNLDSHFSFCIFC